jgi:ubiquinone/menaquinone biosynthesis C-methylase UbiE
MKPASKKWNIQLARWLFSRYMPKKTGWVVDLGAGNGELSYELKNLGLGIMQYDISDMDLEHNLDKITDNSCEYVILKFVIEHIRNIVPLFSECYRILKRGGRVIVLTEDFDKDFFYDPTHVTPFALDRLKNLALMTDFKIVECRYWRNVPYLWRKNLKAFDYNFPALRFPKGQFPRSSKQIFGVFEK